MGTFTGIILAVSLLVMVLMAAGFAAEIALANRKAASTFDGPVCWLRQGEDRTNLKELELAPPGWFMPDPLGQLNRRIIGIGLDDPEVLSPHFAIMGFVDGTPRLAAWSYRQMNFWQEDQEVLRRFVSDATREACLRRLNEGRDESN